MTRDASLPAVRQAKPPAPTARLANLEPYLHVDREASRLASAIEGTFFPAIPAVRDELSPAAKRVWHEKNVETLEAWLARKPKLSALLDLEEIIPDALEAQPDRRVTRTALAVLLDTRTRLPLQPDLYVEAATADLMRLGFSPSIVAAACEELRCTATFTPEIAEIIAMCRTKQASLRQMHSNLKRAIQAVYDATSVLLRTQDQLASLANEPAATDADLIE